MHGEYSGRNWKQVKREMQAEAEKSRKDMLNRKMAARLRKEAIEASSEEGK